MAFPDPRTLAGLLAGRLHGEPAAAPIRAVAIDSRRVQAGDVFFALSGRSRDGHGFVGAALAAGASRTSAPARERAQTVRTGRQTDVHGGLAAARSEALHKTSRLLFGKLAKEA